MTVADFIAKWRKAERFSMQKADAIRLPDIDDKPDNLANGNQRTEKERLETLVAERTADLRRTLASLREREQLLAESETRFKALHNASFGGIAIHDQGTILECNLGLSEMTGYDYSELIGMDGLLLIAKRSREAVMKNIRTGYEKPYEAFGVRKNGEEFAMRLEARNVPYKGKQVRTVEFRDITESKRMAKALVEEADHRRILIEQSRDGIVILDQEGKVSVANRRFAAMLGYTLEEVRQLNVWDWDAQWTREELLGMVGEVDATGARFETRHRRKDGSLCDVEISSNGSLYGGRKLVLCVCRDITERKLAAAYREMGLEVLRVLNEPGDLKSTLGRVLEEVKNRTGADAVGLRLQDGEDFPYVAQEGFSEDFLLTENTLAERGADGGVCRSKDGKVCLECTCGLVISGKTDPAHPLFTPGGSFWTNDSAPLLALPPEQDPRHNPRNQCMHHGYASMALIPVRDKERIVGLLHLNDRRKGCFTLATVNILEDIVAHIGAALMRKRTEEDQQRKAEACMLNAQRVESLLRLNRMIGATPQELMDYALEESVRLTRSEIGYLAFLNEDESVLTMNSWSRSAMAECAMADKPFRFPVEGTGLWGEAIRQRRAVITNDYAAGNPLKKGCPQGHVALRRHMNVPVFEGSRIVIVAGVGNKDEAYDLDDVQELTLLINGLWRLLEHRRADAALKHEQSLSKAIIDSIPGAFYMIDEYGRYVRWNAYQRDELVGKSEDQVAGTNAADTIHPDDRTLIQSRIENVLLNGAVETVEGRVLLRGGPDFRWFLMTGRRMLIDGHPFLVGIGIDIHAHKLDEAELQKLDKLQSVGTLAGGIAHDFNNILLGLFGNISIAMDDLPKEHPSYAPLEEAEKSMSRAVRLTKQLLSFAKGGTPVKEHVSLVDMVEEVARFDLTGSNVSLVYQHDADLWPVEADKGQIQQVVSNLVINARQAMSCGGYLHISLENVDLPANAVPGLRTGSYVKVAVRDDGCGIEPKAITKIFDPYFTTKQTGNGLGLATVWSIISKHGGHISVESDLGKGSTFTFYLPASKSAPPVEELSPAKECPIPARPAKILVMDDEDAVSRLVVRMLAPCGYSVAIALSAQETITLYKQAQQAGAPFDAVIMDLTIPGGPGGKEAIKDLLALDPHVRAIVSSGYAGDPIMSDPAAYGFKGSAAKPYTAKALREAVARVLV